MKAEHAELLESILIEHAPRKACARNMRARSSWAACGFLAQGDRQREAGNIMADTEAGKPI